MKFITIISTIIFLSSGFSNINQRLIDNKENSYVTQKFILKDSVAIIPDYINKNIDCITCNINPSLLKPKITFVYFSEYSALYFFISITEKQVYFETFSEDGTIKPSLIYYVETIDSYIYQSIINYFKISNEFESLNYISTSNHVKFFKDSFTFDFGNKMGADKYPLTLLESEYIVKRYFTIINKIAKSNLVFNDSKIKPILFGLFNDEQIKYWYDRHFELSEHRLLK